MELNGRSGKKKKKGEGGGGGGQSLAETQRVTEGSKEGLKQKKKGFCGMQVALVLSEA